MKDINISGCNIGAMTYGASHKSGVVKVAETMCNGLVQKSTPEAKAAYRQKWGWGAGQDEGRKLGTRPLKVQPRR